MAEPPYFHIGIVVPDLEEAIRRFSLHHGLSFPEPAAIRIPDPSGSGADHEIRVVYSKEGEPFYELIEATVSGIFPSVTQGAVHHVGVWEEDMAKRVADLRAGGIAIEASGVGLDGRTGLAEGVVPHWVITEPGPTGLRREYVDAGMRPGIDVWRESGRFPG
ncbi:VOC family protein [Streptomyces sp. NBC_00893]|uniref:VOC family protein n=1 Tax=Streptomyces sp. NBC_00893 TaxID=2975862 RepID=UPI0022505D54|nr:VOC family protein [Streptomyces sp. NBC_00893]MCX4849534.1 VOC family protein [Streptomyces sp. NBC_00893]